MSSSSDHTSSDHVDLGLSVAQQQQQQEEQSNSNQTPQQSAQSEQQSDQSEQALAKLTICRRRWGQLDRIKRFLQDIFDALLLASFTLFNATHAYTSLFFFLATSLLYSIKYVLEDGFEIDDVKMTYRMARKKNADATYLQSLSKRTKSETAFMVFVFVGMVGNLTYDQVMMYVFDNDWTTDSDSFDFAFQFFALGYIELSIAAFFVAFTLFQETHCCYWDNAVVAKLLVGRDFDLEAHYRGEIVSLLLDNETDEVVQQELKDKGIVIEWKNESFGFNKESALHLWKAGLFVVLYSGVTAAVWSFTARRWVEQLPA